MGFSLALTWFATGQIASSMNLIIYGFVTIVCIMGLGWILAPLIKNDEFSTVPQIFGNKFGKSAQQVFSGITIISYIILMIATPLVVGGVIFSKIFEFDYLSIIVIMLLITGIYTVIGGLRSVMYAHLFQSIVVTAISLLFIFMFLNSDEGLNSLSKSNSMQFLNTSITPTDPDIPMLVIIFAATVLGIWYWITNQYVIQRIYSSFRITDIKKGTLLSVLLISIPIIILLLFGLTEIHSNPKSILGFDNDLTVEASVMPNGIYGFAICGFLALMMSTVANAFNSIATLIAYDFIKLNNDDASEHQLIFIARLSTILLVIGSIIFIALVRFLGNVQTINFFHIQAFIAPPIVVTFLFGFFWKKATSSAIIWTLTIGETIAIIKTFESFFDVNLTYDILATDYIYFLGELFILSCVVFISLSFAASENSNRSIWAEKIALNMHKIKN